MAKEICISTTPHETRLAILEDDQLAEVYYERENEYTLAGSIYKGRVTRVLPGMQSSFVDVGLERDAFLYVTDFLEEQEDSEEYTTEPVAGSPAPPRREGAERRGGRGEGREARPEGRAEARSEVRSEPRVETRPAPEAAASEETEGDEETPAGTRRWRGRRGRRKGVRGGLGQPRLSESPENLEEAGTAEQEAAPFAIAERGAPGGVESLRAAAEQPRPARIESLEASAAPAESRGGREARRSPDAGRAPQAIVLPGESLSKYGGSPAPSSAPAPAAAPAAPKLPVNYVAPRPSTLVEVTGDWDGGAVLPGESLSRYRAPVGAPPPLVEPEVMAEAEPGEAQGEAPAELKRAAEGPQILRSAQDDTSSAQNDISSAQDDTSFLKGEGASFEPGQGVAELHAQDAAGELHPHESAGQPHLHESAEEPHPHESAGESHLRESAGEPHLAEGSLEVHESAILRSVRQGADVLARHDEQEGAASQEVSAGDELALSSAHGEAPIAEPGNEDSADHGDAPEFEPEGGSASYRVPGLGTSELRIPFFSSSSSSDEKPEKEREPEVAESFAPASAEVLVVAAEPEQQPVALEATAVEEPQTQGESRSFDLHAGAEAEPTYAEPEGTLLPASDVDGHAAQQLTVLHQDGSVELPEEHNEQPEAGPFEAHGFSLVPEEQAQTQYEEQAQTQYEEQAEVPAKQSFSEMVDQLHGYAAGGPGLLEEEELDGEEYEFELAEVAEDGDHEDLEEETLDGDYAAPAAAGAQGREERASQAAPAPEVDEAESPFGFELVDEEGDEEFAAGGEEEEPAVAAPGRSGEPRRGNRLPGRGGDRRGGRGPSRRSAQTQNLPIISDLLKAGQEILVQIAKEPIAKKGARITSHIALPGRFLVFMPTVHHVGVSRKIASDAERQRLKSILIHERGEQSGGFIVRTAAEGASEEELRADLRFLISLWQEIKQRADNAKAPALIYHDLNLVERILRDQVSANFSTIWVDSESEYERIIRFLNRFQPSLVRRVKLYTKETPLFEHFGIQEEISKALKSKVWLKSGGSIVINQTEALVAIDINTGKYVGKTARLEDTIVKTNLDAIPEIVRQIRLRDLGGIIVIDFIDMDERRNRQRVLQALEEELKHDRAPSKVLQFNDFGLVAITRKRVKQSLERTLSVQCSVCAGTGMVKSPITVANEIYIEMRKMLKHLDGKDVMLRVNPEVVKQLKAGNSKWINELEEMVGKTIIIKSDPALHPEQFDIQ